MIQSDERVNTGKAAPLACAAPDSLLRWVTGTFLLSGLLPFEGCVLVA